MPRNGSGTYTMPGSTFTSGAVIEASAMNAKLADLAQAMTGSLAKDGQTTPTANQAMGGFVHTNVGDASLRNQYAGAGQVQDSAFLWGGTAAGTTTALTISLSPAPTAYAAGQAFQFVTASNFAGVGGPATLNVNSLGAKSVYKFGGTELATNDFSSNTVVKVIYDGTAFQMVAPLPKTQTLTALTVGSLTATAATITTLNTGNQETYIAGTGDGTATVGTGSLRGANPAGTDIAGGALLLKGGQGTGTGAGGAVSVQTAPAGSTGTSANALQTQLQVDSTGRVLTGGASVATGYTARGDVSLPAGGAIYATNTIKAWCLFDGTLTGSNAPTAGFNVTSINRASAGNYTVSFTNAFASTNYGMTGTARGSGGVNQYLISLTSGGTKTVSAIQVNCMIANVGQSDSPEICLMFIGA